MAVLALTPEILTVIAVLRAHAAEHPVDMSVLAEQIKTRAGKRAHMDQMNSQTVDIPFGYLATFSIETNHPKGLTCRHLSISVDRPGMAPSFEAAWAIAEAFGFSGSLQQCSIWPEELQRGAGRHVAVNLVQPLALGVGGSA